MKNPRDTESCAGALEQLRGLAGMVVDVEVEYDDFREAVEEFADAILLAGLARGRRLVVDDAEVEKMAGEVEAEQSGEGEEEEA